MSNRKRNSQQIIYLKQVKKELTCPGKLKSKFLEQMQEDVASFGEENPNATMETLVQRFGEPSDLAHSYIESLDADELNKQIRKSKIIKRIVMFTSLAVLLFALVVAILFIIFITTDNVAVVTYTVSEGETVITGASQVGDGELITDDGVILDESVINEENIVVEDNNVVVNGVIVND